MNTTTFPRATVYAAIDSERAYQDSFWPENAPADPRPLSIGEDILLIEQYHSLAERFVTPNSGVMDGFHDAIARIEHPSAALENIRKIAGIAVRCLENHGGSSPGNPGTLSRAMVYAQIESELGKLRPSTPAIAAELKTIRELANQARAVWSTERRPEIGALLKILEIAVVAVRCMQNFGAPPRKH